MYPAVNALKNISRQKKRYRLFIPLLLCCAILSGLFLTIAAPCRAYTDSVKTDPLRYTAEEAAQITAMEDHVRRTGQSASKAQIGILVVGAAAVFYVASLMIGERFTDVGILFSLGLTRGQIFVSLLTELGTVCVLSLGAGLWLARLTLWHDSCQ